MKVLQPKDALNYFDDDDNEYGNLGRSLATGSIDHLSNNVLSQDTLVTSYVLPDSDVQDDIGDTKMWDDESLNLGISQSDLEDESFMEYLRGCEQELESGQDKDFLPYTSEQYCLYGAVDPAESTATKSSIDFDNDENSHEGIYSTSAAAVLQKENLATNISEKTSVFQMIDSSIQDREMSFEKLPPKESRLRYKSEGKRRIAKSLEAPSTVKLPNLKNIKLKPGEMFVLRLIYATTGQHESNHVLQHIYQLEYNSDDAQKNIDQTICIPLTPKDVMNGKKTLSHLSILKVLLKDFPSELSLVNLSKTAHESENMTNKSKIISKKAAKKLKERYNLSSGRIICQLAIQINDECHCTDIKCEAEVADSSEKSPKKANKRPLPSETDTNDGEQSTSSKSNKRRKRSN